MINVSETFLKTEAQITNNYSDLRGNVSWDGRNGVSERIYTKV